MNPVIEIIRSELILNSDEKIKIQGEKYFRESVKIHGLKSAQVAEIGKKYFSELPDKTKQVVFNLCDELWQTGFLEESFIACMWSNNVRKQFLPEDFSTFDKWVSKFVTNWASCDTLCNHTIGNFIDMYPEYLSGLKKWALSENRWVRRAAAVSLILPARKGKFLRDIFEIADILHSDADDMVRKGYGWMLKAASQSDQDKVFAYVMKRKKTMPRTALRYAIEKMPADLKAKAMARD